MPQLDRPGITTEAPIRTPIVIAQGDTHSETKKDEGHAGEGESAATGTHASTEHGGAHHPEPGEMPDPALLYKNSLMVVTLLVIFALVAKSKAERIPRGFQNLSESIAEGMRNFTVGIIGPGGEKHVPVVGTLFLYIALMNFTGMFPGFHSPTSNITITLALGVFVFLYVQAHGIINNGLWGHFSHFLGPKFGKYPLMAPLMLPIELLSELFRPFTLAIRLFGNIFGEDVILVVLASLGAGSALTSFIPFQFPIMLLGCLTCVVQAMVFATLTCIYLSLVAPHEHEHDDHHAEGAHATGH